MASPLSVSMSSTKGSICDSVRWSSRRGWPKCGGATALPASTCWLWAPSNRERICPCFWTPFWLFQSFFRRLAELGLDDGTQVVFPGYVSTEDLPALYAGAACFVFPSLYEGFGLPVLEAMASGAPVVCSNASSLPEMAGDAALMVDPSNTAGFASAIERVLADGDLRSQLCARGLRRSAQFTWERTARQTMEVYASVLSAGPVQ
jgi:glycosyltransferase involved in cell wall biosynthesis